MKVLSILTGILFCFLSLNGQTICVGRKVVPVESFDQCDHNPWVLVFEDDFNGNSLDLSKWNYGPRIRYCNDEQQYYTSGENIEVSNGTLKIISRKEPIHAKAVDWLPEDEILLCNGKNRGQNARLFHYTSGNIETIEKFTYGKFEARVRIPKGKGFWPAFWLFSHPPYNEIDIFEFMGNEKVHEMAVHFDYNNNDKASRCGTKYKGPDLSRDFHVFTFIWEKNKMEWFVDGVSMRVDYKYYTLLGQPVECFIKNWELYIMNRIFPKDPMHIILNLAIISGTNAPDKNTTFPGILEIDHVRYYQRLP